MGLLESIRRFQLGRYGFLGLARTQTRTYLGELATDARLLGELRGTWDSAPSDAKQRIGATLWATGPLERRVVKGPYALSAAEAYILARAMAPDSVVETGVAAGVSSTFFLAALERNGKGELWSIDLPNRDPQGVLNADGRRDLTLTPEGVQPGWIVPSWLRHRWHLSLGDSTTLLPKVLGQTHPQIFFHDSEHSYSAMTREYATAWSGLGPGQWIYSDDVNKNRAFRDFVRTRRVRAKILPTGRGIFRIATPK